MTFQWSDYCHLAKYLQGGRLEGVNPEACHRSAVSRAYYSAFCSARNYRQEKTGSKLPENSAVHHDVQVWFESRKDPSSRAIASQLAILWQKRLQADYDDLPRTLNPEKDSALCILLAEEVLKKLGEIY